MRRTRARPGTGRETLARCSHRATPPRRLALVWWHRRWPPNSSLPAECSFPPEFARRDSRAAADALRRYASAPSAGCSAGASRTRAAAHRASGLSPPGCRGRRRQGPARRGSARTAGTPRSRARSLNPPPPARARPGRCRRAGARRAAPACVGRRDRRRAASPPVRRCRRRAPAGRWAPSAPALRPARPSGRCPSGRPCCGFRPGSER